MQLYAPSAVIVIVAWLACIANQTTYGDLVSVLLAMLFLYYSYITVMPKVNAFKAIDIYLSVAFFFIFMALVYTFCFKRHQNGAEIPQSKILDDQKEKTRFSFDFKYVFIYILYPTLFFLFCCCYFSAFLFGSFNVIDANDCDIANFY